MSYNVKPCVTKYSW